MTHQVRYLIVDGLAVVAHGLDRFTAGVDIVLAVDETKLAATVAAFKSLGYGPRAPVPFEQFIDPKMRQQWAAEKNMMVFSLFAPAHSRTEVDLFLEPPFDFNAAYGRSMVQPITGGLSARFCGLEDLLELRGS